jgi:hypothetical protein
LVVGFVVVVSGVGLGSAVVGLGSAVVVVGFGAGVVRSVVETLVVVEVMG